MSLFTLSLLLLGVAQTTASQGFLPYETDSPVKIISNGMESSHAHQRQYYHALGVPSTCTLCVASNQFWNSDSTCSATSQLGSLSTIQQCISNNFAPSNQVTESLTPQSGFLAGVLTYPTSPMTLSPTTPETLLTITNQLTVPVNYTATCTNGISLLTIQNSANICGSTIQVSAGNSVKIYGFVTEGSTGTFSFNFAVSSLYPDCVSCVASQNYWTPNLLCFPATPAATNALKTVSTCISNNQLPVAANQMNVSVSTASAFMGGVMQSNSVSISSNLLLNITNTLPFSVMINPVLSTNTSVAVYSGVGVTPQAAAAAVASQTLTQGTTVPSGSTLLYVISASSPTSAYFKYKIISQSGASDCVSCTVNSYIWNSNFGCQQTVLNVTGSSSYSTIDSCVQAGLTPTNASYTLNIDQSLSYMNGVATTKTYSYNVSDVLFNFVNSFKAPVNVTIPCSNGLQAYLFNGTLSNATVSNITCSGILTLPAQQSAYVIFYNSMGNQQSLINFNVTLQNGQGFDCITCVLSGQNWSPNTLCTNISGGFNTLSQCFTNNQLPLTVANYTLGPQSSFVNGQIVLNYTLTSDTQLQDMFLTIDNDFHKNLTVSVGQQCGALVAYSGVGANQNSAIGAVVQSNAPTTIQGGDTGVFVLNQAHGECNVTITVQLSTLALDCVSCVAGTNVWNPNTLCSKTAYLETNTYSNITQCLQAGILPQMQNPINVQKSILNVGRYSQTFQLLPNTNSQDQVFNITNQLQAESIKFSVQCNSSSVMAWIHVGPTPNNPMYSLQPYTCGQNYTIGTGQNVGFLVLALAPVNVTVFGSIYSLAEDCISCVTQGLYWQQNSFCTSIYEDQSSSYSTIQSCIISQELPASQTSMNFDYAHDFVNGTFSQGYSMQTPSSDYMFNFTNQLGKNLTVSVSCYGNTIVYFGVSTSMGGALTNMLPLSCNQTFNMTPVYNSSVVIVVAPQPQKIRLNFVAVSVTPDFITCVAQNLYWTDDFQCSPTIIAGNYTLSQAAQSGLLPSPTQLPINSNTQFSQGKSINTYNFDPNGLYDAFYSIHNSVYDSFKVLISCTPGSIVGWYATGTNIETATFTQLGCGDFFLITSGQTQNLILSQVGAPAQANITFQVSYATDCITCVSINHFWDDEGICANITDGDNSTASNVTECVLNSYLPPATFFSNITYNSSTPNGGSRTYLYQLNATQDDQVIIVNNSLTSPVTLSLACTGNPTIWAAAGDLDFNMTNLVVQNFTCGDTQTLNGTSSYSLILWAQSSSNVTLTTSTSSAMSLFAGLGLLFITMLSLAF